MASVLGGKNSKLTWGSDKARSRGGLAVKGLGGFVQAPYLGDQASLFLGRQSDLLHHAEAGMPAELGDLLASKAQAAMGERLLQLPAVVLIEIGNEKRSAGGELPRRGFHRQLRLAEKMQNMMDAD
jgi:hypothetical protein